MEEVFSYLFQVLEAVSIPWLAYLSSRSLTHTSAVSCLLLTLLYVTHPDKDPMIGLDLPG